MSHAFTHYAALSGPAKQSDRLADVTKQPSSVNVVVFVDVQLFVVSDGRPSVD